LRLMSRNLRESGRRGTEPEGGKRGGRVQNSSVNVFEMGRQVDSKLGGEAVGATWRGPQAALLVGRRTNAAIVRLGCPEARMTSDRPLLRWLT
jgi:hypothetical protein